MALRVVLDACVLYPVSLRDALLRLAESGFYQPIWSDVILEEMKNAVLRSRPDIDESRFDRMIQQMRSAFPEAEVRGWEPLKEQMTNHEGDRHVLAAAVRSRADLIVTGNVKHFPPNSCEPYCVDVVEPDDFLCQLFEVSPHSVLAMIERLSEDTSDPPLEVVQVIESLRRSAPEFAGIIEVAFRESSSAAGDS